MSAPKGWASPRGPWTAPSGISRHGINSGIPSEPTRRTSSRSPRWPRASTPPATWSTKPPSGRTRGGPITPSPPWPNGMPERPAPTPPRRRFKSTGATGTSQNMTSSVFIAMPRSSRSMKGPKKSKRLSSPDPCSEASTTGEENAGWIQIKTLESLVINTQKQTRSCSLFYFSLGHVEIH
ncbi:hypothetical protein TRIP_B250138 [uncultured Desulfatiglans sp.]|nr:hypothetical protein TRIP_B250138 [uncultured Desulfatiglans sp.]